MTRPLAYEVVDVFTGVAFAGNPLAVVLGADDLPNASLQALAREFNLSETAFPTAARDGADYGLRIFTPEVELPFAGHPSIGAAWVLHRRGLLADGPVVQACGAGMLDVVVDATGATLSGGRPSLGQQVPAGPVLAAVGLTDDDLVAAPVVAGCGLDFVLLQVVPDAVGRLAVDASALRALDLATGLSVFAVEGEQVHARVLVPEVGVAEDPATGSAALALGVVLARELPDGTSSYVVRQGAEVGRPSVLRCTVTTRSGRAVATTVRGEVVPVARGEVRVPPA